MSSFVITTEKDDYTGGETIRGQAVLTVDEPVVARGVRIRFQAYEHAYWTTGSGKNRTTHQETKYHVNQDVTVFGQEPLGTMAIMADALKGIFTKSHYDVIQPGTYEYGFEFVLPPNVPADYESGGSSKIAYEVTAYVDIPLKYDIEAVKKLTVYETIDHGKVKPVTGSNSKTFMFDSGNPLDMSVTIDSNMYFPGDKGQGVLEVTNRSSKDIDVITISLQQVTHLKAHYSKTTRTETIELNRMDKPVIPKGQPTSFKFDFQIPQHMYSTSMSGEVVRVEYQLVVNLDVPWAIDLDVCLPIVLLEEAGVPSGVSIKP